VSKKSRDPNPSSKFFHFRQVTYTGGSKRPGEMSALDRLKLIQANFLKNWNGVACEYTGRPGTSQICNKKRNYSIQDKSSEEDERQRQLFKLFQIIRGLEEDLKSSQAAGSKTSQNFFSSQQQSNLYAVSSKNFNDFLQFKLLKESQSLKGGPPGVGYGARSYHIENSELLYKMLRGDNRMVRSVCEANGFTHTESHEWNLLWSTASCKSYIYEGLNEY